MKQMTSRVMISIVFSVVLSSCALSPKPLTMDEIRTRSDRDLELMFAGQEAITGPVTLYEAMARAILYNLDSRLTLMEKALAVRQLDVSRFEQLPSLAANAGYSWRNEYHGANSMGLTGASAGAESLTMSTSQEKTNLTARIGMVWNVLDFGVSYARTRQAGDSLLIAEEHRRKVIQNILRDVRYAFWRAVGAENVLPDMTSLLRKTESAMERSSRIADEKIRPLQVTLEYQQALLENIRLLRGLIQQLSSAKTELATLMNIPPGTDFTLSDHPWRTLEIPELRMDPKELEQMALLQRPELRQEDYRLRINELEARKAILGMLPGIDLNFGYNFDSNDYLYRNDWLSAGTQVSMNLFRLFSGPARYKTAKAMQEVDVLRRRTLSMAALTQVHLAFHQYVMTADEFRVSRQLTEVSERLARLMADNEASGKSSELAAILSATHAMTARMKHHLIHAELENAVGRIYSSAGMDLMPGSIKDANIRSLAAEIENAMRGLESAKHGE